MTAWDLWVDYHRTDGDGLTHTHLEDVESDIEIVPGVYVVVGNEEADPAVAEVVSVESNGIVLLRVLPGPAEEHLHLAGRQSLDGAGVNGKDELEETIREFEARHPGIRADMRRMGVVLRMTTALWQRREELGLSVEQVAERSGLTIDEVEAVEDNDVDSSFQRLARYAEAVGLKFELQQVPA